MPNAHRNAQAPWQDVQLEAAAQLSALCLQIGAGHYPWQDAKSAAAPAPTQARQTSRKLFEYDLLVV